MTTTILGPAGESWRIPLEAKFPSKKKRQPRILGPAGQRLLEAKLPSRNQPQKVPSPEAPTVYEQNSQGSGCGSQGSGFGCGSQEKSNVKEKVLRPRVPWTPFVKYDTEDDYSSSDVGH